MLEAHQTCVQISDSIIIRLLDCENSSSIYLLCIWCFLHHWSFCRPLNCCSLHLQPPASRTLCSGIWDCDLGTGTRSDRSALLHLSNTWRQNRSWPFPTNERSALKAPACESIQPLRWRTSGRVVHHMNCIMTTRPRWFYFPLSL